MLGLNREKRGGKGASVLTNWSLLMFVQYLDHIFF